VGAINGALLAADPTRDAVARLTGVWSSLSSSEVFGGSSVRRLRHVARTGTHAHPNDALRRLLHDELGDARIEDLAVPFQCCAASIERASEHWFESGPVVEAVLASSAVPGLLPPVRVGDEHFLDGGLVDSIPVGRAVALGATTVYVLQVGRVEKPLTVPTRPWEVALVAFEIARRHRYARDMAAVPEGVTVHVLPTGDPQQPRYNELRNLRYRDFAAIPRRVELAYAATLEYLEEVSADSTDRTDAGEVPDATAPRGRDGH
jgi:NTE family protein